MSCLVVPENVWLAREILASSLSETTSKILLLALWLRIFSLNQFCGIILVPRNNLINGFFFFLNYTIYVETLFVCFKM